MALVAFVIGVAVGAGHSGADRDTAESFARAWARGDYAAMHALITTADQRRTSLSAFTRAYAAAADTATVRRLRVGEVPGVRNGVVAVPVTVATRIFGTVREPVDLPVVDDDGEARVDWEPHLVFPGLRAGERLTRTTRLAPRGDLRAHDGTPIAAGPERTSPDPVLAQSIGGTVGPIPAERATLLRELGVPADADVGLTGLERALDVRLLGRPGGELLAGARVLARSAPERAAPVRTSIVPRVQRAAVEALGGRLGGIVALRTGGERAGEVLAASGIGFSGLQPPGSTFKVITLVGALEARMTSPRTQYPVETAATLEGVRLENANGESCGGDLVASFAHSCNSVFAPLGARLGAPRLVEAAERFGFNAPPGIPGAAASTIPAADDIGDDLALGSTAIGQGRVQATALQMAIVAATIAERGRRPLPSVVAREPRGTRPVTRPEIARQVDRMMRAVVREGTGTSAAIPGVTVAGKTGTAELGNTTDQEPEAGGAPPPETTAWFIAYAPARRPRVAVAVLLVEAGAGGDVAAPAARQVLAAALGR